MDNYFNYIKVKQPMTEFYVFKIDGKDLYQMCKTDVLRFEAKGKEIGGIQRKLDTKRAKKIAGFIDYVRACFPTSVVLSVSSNNIWIDENNSRLCIPKKDNIFSIIDGQHRIAGFAQSTITFDVVVSLFIDVEKTEESELFNVINAEQKAVSSSFSIALEHYTFVKTPERIVTDIAMIMTRDESSPLYSVIKIPGVANDGINNDDSTLSLSAFAQPIIDAIYDDTNYYRLKGALITYQEEKKLEDCYQILNTIDFSSLGINEKLFGKYYVKDEEYKILKILYNFWNGVKEVLPNSFENRKSSLLLKTAGYNSFMKFFLNNLFTKMEENKNFTKEEFVKQISCFKQIDGEITSDNYGSSGKMCEDGIYNKLLELSGFAK